ncbi:MAG: type II secretion system F family protein [Deltaproteobacteria bacterium]|nr:type II secretion system F family protein [Deltaproteobacteria bacterium]
MAITFDNKDVRSVARPAKALSSFSFSKLGDTLRRFGKTVKPAELIFFTAQLSLMLEIGTSLNNSLKAIANQTENPAFKKVIQDMHKVIEEGQPLSNAMKRHPRVFDNVFTSMIKAGETGGFLKDILDRIVEMQEKRQQLITQIKTALTYPAFLCGIGFLAVIFITVGVLPKFTAFFAGKEKLLPPTTRFLMATSASLREYWWIYILVFAGIVIGLKLFKESRQGKILIDRFFVSVPPIAGLSNKIYTCELLRTLGNLMASKVPLLDALTVTRGTIKNHFFRKFIDQITEHVKQGGRFSQPFADNPYILASVKEMVGTGEEAGDLPRVMQRLARFYDNEVDGALKTLSSMIEPAALIVLGGMVGVIVSAVILPIFRLGTALH